MKAFQMVMAVVTALMMLGMFGFNLWINSNFAVRGTAVPKCYMPMNVITTVLVLITVITIFIRK